MSTNHAVNYATKNKNMKKTFFKCVVFWFLALILVLAMSFIPVSCKTLKSKESFSRKDSTSSNISFRKKDTIITVPGQTLRLSVPVLQLDNAPAVYKTERGSLTISKNGENITAECNIEEYKATITLLEKTISIFSQTVISQEKIITEQKSLIGQLWDLLKIAGVLAIIFLVFAAVIFFKKRSS